MRDKKKRFIKSTQIPERTKLADCLGAVDRVRYAVVAADRAEAPHVGDRVVQRVAKDPTAVIVRGVAGTRGLEGRVHDAHADHILEALERAHHQGTMGPRARIRNVQVVSARLGWVLGSRLRGHEVAEGRCGAHERAIGHLS